MDDEQVPVTNAGRSGLCLDAMPLIIRNIPLDTDRRGVAGCRWGKSEDQLKALMIGGWMATLPLTLRYCARSSRCWNVFIAGGSPAATKWMTWCRKP